MPTTKSRPLRRRRRPKPIYSEPDICKMNKGVQCDKKDHCESCGWNPAVAEERLDKIYMKIMREDPELFDRL